MRGPPRRFRDFLDPSERISLPAPLIAEQAAEAPADDAELLACQPSALFLLDQAGLVVRLGGNWRHVTRCWPNRCWAVRFTSF